MDNLEHTKCDIYLNNEKRDIPKPNNPKFHRRRRRHTPDKQLPFDDPRRHKRPASRRRSRNKGLRHLRHVLKKPYVQKRILWTIGILTVLMLVLLGLWQYWLRDKLLYRNLEQNAQTTEKTAQ